MNHHISTETVRRKKTFAFVMAGTSILSVSLAIAQICFRGLNYLVGDGLYWHLAAKYLAEGRGFLHPIVFLGTGVETQAADHPPLFILYLATLSKLGLGSVFSHQMATAIIAAAVVPLLGLVGYKIGGYKTGIITMILGSLHPLLWGWSPLVMSEPMAVVAVLVLILVALHYRESEEDGRTKLLLTIALGVVIGLSTLTRSELLLTGTLIALVVCHSRSFIVWLKRLLLVGLACLITLSPWIGYNLSRFEKPVLLSIGSDITFASAYCDDTFYGEFVGYWSFSCQQAAWDYANAMATVENPDQSELMPFVKEYWRDYLSENKSRAMVVVPLRVARSLGLYKPQQQMNLEKDVDGKSPEVIYGSWLMFYSLIPLALIGWARGKLLLTTKLILLVPLFTSIVTVAITWGNPRYRFSIDIVLLLLGAFGVSQLFSRQKLK